MLNNKNRLIYLISIACVSIALILLGINMTTSSNKNDTNSPQSNTVEGITFDKVNHLISNKDTSTVEGLYINSVNSLDELIERADIILRGTPNEIIHESSVGMIQSVIVEEVIKGDNNDMDSIEIVQLKDEYQLEIGTSYLLALELDSKLNGKSYHVIGGMQGTFEIENAELECHDESLQDELVQILNESSKIEIEERSIQEFKVNSISESKTSSKPKVKDVTEYLINKISILEK